MNLILPALIKDNFTKKEIQEVAINVITEITEGGKPVLDVVEKIAATEELIKQIKANTLFKDAALAEIEKHKKYTSPSGTKIEAMEGGTTYDYSGCNDSLYEGLVMEMETLKTLMKDRETFLKAIPPFGLDVMQEGGEIVQLLPPLKKSTSTYKVSLK